MAAWASTGLPGLDNVVNDLRKGDNVVWQVDKIEDFKLVVQPYVKKALLDGRNMVYMRFADHEPLIEPHPKIKTYQLDAVSGFETFSSEVHSIISKEGKEAYYVFDCLSDLLSSWATDLMIGNFFMVTCPYLYELDTIAYFALLRNNHSFKTVARIRGTTQLLLDLYHFEDDYYVHPLKVWHRYSPTMFLPHLKKNDKFVPITNSLEATKLISFISQQGLEPTQRALDYWDRLFWRAEELSQDPDASEDEKSETVEQLCKVMIGREEKILSLAKKHLSLEDLLSIEKRLIGTGYIGGKAVGMLIANSIVSKKKEIALEPHDSFYVGSDVFYTYIVENGWWKLRMEQKTKDGYFKVADELRDKLLNGKFPDQVREQFQEMIEYFGQSPIIIRSSSLLEDAFGNAFAGKYESYFCVNQGSPDERYEQFEKTVRKVYASTMSKDALVYRLQRGLDQQDEQMALLIQRVSGSYKNHYFYPDLAGVGISHNTFAWNPQLDPKAGLLRLVYGLGTRAVNRVDEDYPRVIALDEPLVRPLSSKEDQRKYSQHQVDLLDILQNKISTVELQDLLGENPDLREELIMDLDLDITRRYQQAGQDKQYWLMTFKKLLAETKFTEKMQQVLKTLEHNYHYPVDIEFTVNFSRTAGDMVVNILQCRPLQTKGQQPHVEIPEQLDEDKILFRCRGHFMGGNLSQNVSQIIYVEPAEYIALPLSQKYDIARLIGKLNTRISDRDTTPTLLFGPGRWGTTTPSLGVPVSFHEINNITVMIEMAYEGGNLMPELSYGTHFFQDLVESDIFYVALFPDKKDVTFNKQWFEDMPNELSDFLPEYEKYAHVVKYNRIDKQRVQFICDLVTQQTICLFE